MPTPSSPTPLRPEVIRERILRDFRTVWAGRARHGPYQARLSSAGKCVRALSYHRQGAPESNPTPARAGLRFDLGDLIHLYLDDKLRALHYPLERREHRVEIQTPSGLVITGHFDRSIGGSTILDYKSASDAAFRMMADRNEPLHDYLWQLTGYLEACRQTPELEQYTHGLVVVVNKDSRDKSEDGIDLWISQPIADNSVIAQQIIEKFEAVEQHARTHTLPDRPYASPAEYPCKFCAWRGLCWGDALPAAGATPAADLSGLRDAARAYGELGTQLRELERDRDRVGGQLRAALTDAGTRVGTTGAHEIKLVTQTRTSLNPDLVPADIRARATVTTEVTQLRVTTTTPNDPQPTGPPASSAPAPVAAPPATSVGADTPASPAPSGDASRFLRTGKGRYVTHKDFLAYIGHAAARERPTAADPLAWLRRHGFPADIARLTPAQVDRASAIAQRIITAPRSRKAV